MLHLKYISLALTLGFKCVTLLCIAKPSLGLFNQNLKGQLCTVSISQARQEGPVWSLTGKKKEPFKLKTDCCILLCPSASIQTDAFVALNTQESSTFYYVYKLKTESLHTLFFLREVGFLLVSNWMCMKLQRQTPQKLYD